MKNLFKISMAAALSLAMSFGMTSCNTPKDGPVNITLKASNVSDKTATVTIENIGSGVTGFKYAIGKPSQKNEFLTGTLEGIKNETNMSVKSLVFEGLTPETSYSVFVQPYSANQNGLVVVSNFTTIEEIIDEYDLAIDWALDGLSAISLTMRVNSFGTHATSYEYAIGKESDLASFENGTMIGLVKGDDVKVNKRFVFTDLTNGTDYVVFARSCRDDEKGPVASFKVKTLDMTIAPKIKNLTSNSVSFEIKIGTEITSFKYAVDSEGAEDAFNKDFLGSIIWEENPAGKTITQNVTDLKPRTKYIIYAQGFADNGTKTVIIQFPFTTKEAE